MTSKRLRFDVVMTLSLHHVPVGQKRIYVRMLKKQFDHSGTEIEIFQDENFVPMWFFASITSQVIISRHIHDGMTMLDKPQVWVSVFMSSTRRIPTTCAISVLLDENERYFYFIWVNYVCQGLNKYEKISIHIVSH